MEKSYIDPNIVITESLPKNLLWLIDRVEQSDKENKLAYFDCVDDLDINAKNAYVAGCISKKTWDLLMQKYYVYALEIEAEEETSQTIPKTLDAQIQQAREKTRDTVFAGEQENKKRLLRNNEELLR